MSDFVQRLADRFEEQFKYSFTAPTEGGETRLGLASILSTYLRNIDRSLRRIAAVQEQEFAIKPPAWAESEDGFVATFAKEITGIRAHAGEVRELREEVGTLRREFARAGDPESVYVDLTISDLVGYAYGIGAITADESKGFLSRGEPKARSIVLGKIARVLYVTD